MAAYHFERALFVGGETNSGISNQLRSMFREIRLGTDGNIPTERKLPELYRLSNERCLYLRLTSPHEAKETIGRKHGRNGPTNFLEKTAQKIDENTPRLGSRWNYRYKVTIDIPSPKTARSWLAEFSAVCITNTGGKGSRRKEREELSGRCALLASPQFLMPVRAGRPVPFVLQRDARAEGSS